MPSTVGAPLGMLGCPAGTPFTGNSPARPIRVAGDVAIHGRCRSEEASHESQPTTSPARSPSSPAPAPAWAWPPPALSPQAGAAVGLADVNEAACAAATEELRDAGHQVLTVVCDVSDEDQVAARSTHRETFGRLDMAFNNAGIQAPPTDAADEPAENFDRVNNINLRGIWACMKHELRQMRDPGQRGDRELLLARRPGRPTRPRRLPRLQARCDRADQERRPRVRAPRDPDQRGLPGHHRHPDGRRHGRQRRPRPRRSRRRPPIGRLGRAERSPPPCCGCAAPAPASSSGSPCPSTAATPPADHTSTKGASMRGVVHVRPRRRPRRRP